jgi:hypothetical protein
VHGFISVDATDCRIVDCEPFQRLKGIHQLAMASHLYPGATHSRFEHSLGVYHVAAMMCQRLRIKADQRHEVLQAALLHDIGHGPFSHVSEGPLGSYATPAMLAKAGGNPEAVHELVTCDIVEKHPGLPRSRSLRREAIIALISGNHPDRLMRSIISGPLDADKQDYLLRDSLMCGVRYGVFDLDRLVRCLKAEDDGHGRVIMVAPDGTHAVEQFAIAKYYITTQVYGHRVRMITDQMLTRAIRLGIDADGIDWLHELYAYDGSEEFVIRYTSWDDWKLLRQREAPGLAGTWFARLLDQLHRRQLHKQLFSRKLEEFPVQVRDALSKLERKDRLRRRLEETVCQVLARESGTRLDPKTVIIHTHNKSPLPSTRDESVGAVLVDVGPSPVPFEEESRLFRAIAAATTEYWLSVFAPVPCRTETERDRLVASLRDPVLEAITAAADLPESEGEDRAHA